MNYAKRHPPEEAAARLASEFLGELRTSGLYLGEHLSRLAGLAMSADGRAAKEAAAAIFKRIVEPLADSFDPAAVSLYNRAFAQLVQLCRAAPGGDPLDSRLDEFGLSAGADIISRADGLRRVRPVADPDRLARDTKRAVVLSRVTLGADVAITSVAIERLKRALPLAEIVLVGGRKAAELFGGDPRLSFREVDYQRAGTLMGRLLSWIDLLDAVAELRRGLARGQCLVVDPDTRLTQLGLLPVTHQHGGDYLFFPSREYGHASALALGELTSLWLDEVFGAAETTRPRVSLARRDLEQAGEMIGRLRRGGAQRVVSINFGVGENPMKRLDDEFEKSLVVRLIAQGATVVFDKGAGEEEARRADAVIAEATPVSGLGVIELDETNLARHLSSDRMRAALVVWRGRIGAFAAMIGQSDLYIGYDSAGQHIAAALGVPCVDVFAGFTSPRMLDRWRPTGKAESRVIAVDGEGNRVDSRAVLADTLNHACEMMAREGGKQSG
jgi:ADP-heptose:LPS heptosyltransferase